MGVVTAGYLLSAVAGWWLALRTVNPGRTEMIWPSRSRKASQL